MGVSEILKISTASTLTCCEENFEIRRDELKEQLHFASLEKIFIEKEIYEGIKKCRTGEEIDKAIVKGFKPFLNLLIRPIDADDLHRLRKIPSNVFRNSIRKSRRKYPRYQDEHRRS